MESKPLVTIGIANFNYANYIIGALNSVVNQDYENIEIVIVDDYSSDNSVAEIEKWLEVYKGDREIILIKNPSNLGIAKVSNIILQHANGKYFHPLDADDLLYPDKVSKQVMLLEENGNTALVYANANVINKQGELIHKDYLARINYDRNDMPSGQIFENLLTFNFIAMPGVLINTNKARAIGGYDESIQVQDYYMWLKLAEKYDVIYHNDIVASYRVHAGSLSNTPSSSAKSEDGAINLKYRYYDRSSSELKETIKRNIQNSSVYLYQENYPTAKKWLHIAFKLKPGLKTFFYFIASTVGVKYSMLKRIIN